ncbi:MAG: hypothetical protein WCV67_20090 [Victivallaceae bacterium]
MRKLLLCFVMFLAFTIVHASSSDAIEVFISAGNSVSLSTTGKVLRLNMSSGIVIYDNLNRAVQVGDVSVTYDELSRVIQVGNISVKYDQSSRVIKIDNTAIAYDISNRVVKIGDATLTYDELSRVINITGKTPDNLRFATVPGQT